MANILCILFHNWKYTKDGLQRACDRPGCEAKQILKCCRWTPYTPLNKPKKKFISQSHLIKDKEL